MDFDGIIDDMRLETLVWWSQTGSLDGAGNYIYSAGVEIKGRWEDRKENFITSEGEEKTSKAVVYPDESKNIKVNDQLFRGELTDLDSAQTANPNLKAEAYRIQALNSSKDIDTETTMKEAFL
jgi:hypothetical protein